MILKGNAIFKEKLTDGLKNDITNLINSCANSRTICTLVRSIRPKHIKF